MSEKDAQTASIFTPQPLVARGIAMAMTDGRAEWAGGWADRFCPKQNSAPNV